jgi:hypothetical protein
MDNLIMKNFLGEYSTLSLKSSLFGTLREGIYRRDEKQ